MLAFNSRVTLIVYHVTVGVFSFVDDVCWVASRITSHGVKQLIHLFDRSVCIYQTVLVSSGTVVTWRQSFPVYYLYAIIPKYSSDRHRLNACRKLVSGPSQLSLIVTSLKRAA